MIKIFSLCVIFLALSACATSQNYLATINSWQGQSVNKLVKLWGYPDQTAEAPDGNKLYIYHYSDRGRNPVIAIPGYTNVVQANNQTYVETTPTTFTGGGSYNFHCKTWFEVNRKNIIVNTAVRGNACVASKSFRESKSAF